MNEMFTRQSMSTVVAEILYPPKTGLIDLFFSNKEVNTHDTTSVLVDVKKSSRGLATYSQRGMAGTQVEDGGYEEITFIPPYICEEKTTRASAMLKKDVGSDPFKQEKQRERAAKKLVSDLNTLKERAKRAEVKQVADSIATGKLVVTESGKTRTIEFYMPDGNKIVLTGVDLWSDPASDPIGDIRAWRRQIQEMSGLDMDAMVFAADVIDAFTAHAKVQTYFDNRRMTLGKSEAKKLPNGLTQYADVEGTEIYEFNEWYKENGVNKPMIAANTILFGSTEAKVSIEYGAIELVDDELAWVEEGDYFADSYTDVKAKAMIARLQTAPLYALTQSDAFGNAKVL